MPSRADMARRRISIGLTPHLGSRLFNRCHEAVHHTSSQFAFMFRCNRSAKQSPLIHTGHDEGLVVVEFEGIIGGEKGFLDGKFLVAMPAMDDPRFEKAVVLLAGHSPKGALGFVLNHPVELSVAEMYRKVGINVSETATALTVVRGGPVEPSRGFVVHSDDYVSSSTMRLGDGLGLTSTIDILRAMGSGIGPKCAVLALGYAAWGEGQLESELMDNTWLTAEAERSILFDVPLEERYSAVFSAMGIKPDALSGVAGNA